ncbi:MAG TPA: hypothetical protein VH701_01545 [Vicinamibacterales bacterium]|jgi:hypothetical protein
MRRHHEELAAAPSVMSTLSLLIPFAAALWVRIKTVRKPGSQSPDKPDWRR